MNLEIYEINSLNWLNELSAKYKKEINLARVPDEELVSIQRHGFNAVWMMGVWQRSLKAIEINKRDAAFMAEIKQILPDDGTAHLAGSAYSIKEYVLSPALGTRQDLIDFKYRLNQRGINLILDFVPNHTAIDSSWTADKPEYFLSASDEEVKDQPNSFITVSGHNYALGKDPQYEPWIDVVQLNAFSDSLRSEAARILKSIATLADGVRCDMAMLLLNQVFSETWGSRCGDVPKTEYWQQVISEVRIKYPDFLFIAEAYWHSEDELMALGFDYVYDKEFYDFLWGEDCVGIKRCLSESPDKQKHLLRFIENHDEDRASAHPLRVHRLVAAVFVASPGAHLYCHGQLTGRKVRTPVQLSIDATEKANKKVARYYVELFKLREQIGDPWYCFELLEVGPENETVLCWRWQFNEQMFLAAANFNHCSLNFSVDTEKNLLSVRQIFATCKKTASTIVNQGTLQLGLRGKQLVVIELVVDAK